MSAPMTASAGRALDRLNFFCAMLQDAFGPFVVVYLTQYKWTQADIGLILSVGTAMTVVSRVPGGALVDAIGDKRRAVLVGVLGVAACAAVLAVLPAPWPVALAQALHGFASSMLVAAIAALSLALAGPEGFPARIGRNARYAAAGSACGALVMGLIGYFVSTRAVFWLAAGLALPALAAVGRMGRPAAVALVPAAAARMPVRSLLRDQRLLVFAGCVVLFHLSNAALLPLVGEELTEHAGDLANLMIGGCIVGPQLIVAALSPAVAGLATRWGRRPLLLLGFVALPLRAAIFAASADPAVVVAAQALDGVSATVFGVLLPVVTADISGRSGHYGLSLSLLGFAVGIGATLSTTLAGAIATEAGNHAAFLALTLAEFVAVAAVGLVMPETGTGDGSAKPPPRAAEPGHEGVA